MSDRHFFSTWFLGYSYRSQVPIFLALAFLAYSPPLFRMLPFILVSSSFSIISGFVVSKMGRNLPGIWFGSTLLAVGTGLLIMLDYTSSMYVLCFLSNDCFTTLNDPKCRTRDFPADRSHRRRLFIPDSDSDTTGSDAYEGYGYCDERLPVPSVSNYFFVCSVRQG